MSEKNYSPAAAAPAGLPGVSAGKTSAGLPPANGVATADPGSPGGKNPVPPAKKLFGGNVGKKQRADGLAPGSPEALQADRDADAKRKRDARAAARAAEPPAALPAVPPPAVESLGSTPAPAADALGTGAALPVAGWAAQDFRECAGELIELAESWRVDEHTKNALAGKLPAVVVEKIKGRASFPAGSKRSLRESSPETLARMFNALSVPTMFKPYVSAFPALVYIVVRDLQTGAEIKRLVKENEKFTASQTPPPANHTG